MKGKQEQVTKVTVKVERLYEYLIAIINQGWISMQRQVVGEHMEKERKEEEDNNYHI